MSGTVPGRTITKRKMVTLRQPGTEKNGCSAPKGAAADFPQQMPPDPVLAGVGKVTSHEQFS